MAYDTGTDDKNKHIEYAKYLYGSAGRDYYFFRNPDSLPRYGHLARKLIIHYAGSAYNPHTVDYVTEVYIRSFIRDAVEYKVTNKVKGYDCELYDNFFKKIIGESFDLDLPYDLARIERGFDPQFKPAIPMNFDLPI